MFNIDSPFNIVWEISTNPWGRFSLVFVFVTLEGHLSSVLALFFPDRWIKAF